MKKQESQGGKPGELTGSHLRLSAMGGICADWGDRRPEWRDTNLCGE